MDISKFTLYDIIVDIVPGILAVVIVLPLIPKEFLAKTVLVKNIVFLGVVIAAVAYTIGRLLHGLGGILEEKSLSFDIRDEKGRPDKLSSDIVQSVCQEIDQNIYRHTETIPSASELHPQLETISSTVNQNPENVDPKALKELINKIKQSSDQNVEKSDTDIAQIRKYGESVLYGKETLYQRYNILSSFYRSMTMLMLGAGILYTVYAVTLRVNFGTGLDPAPIADLQSLVIGFGLLFFTATGICLTRWKKWIKNRDIAFYNDLHRHYFPDD